MKQIKYRNKIPDTLTKSNVTQRQRHGYQFGQREGHPVGLLFPALHPHHPPATVDAVVELGVVDGDQ